MAHDEGWDFFNWESFWNERIGLPESWTSNPA
jgi:hypothetical protein